MRVEVNIRTNRKKFKNLSFLKSTFLLFLSTHLSVQIFDFIFFAARENRCTIIPSVCLFMALHIALSGLDPTKITYLLSFSYEFI